MAIAPPSLRPVPLPGAWRFWADMIVTGQPLGPVTCTAFTGSRLLSGFGTGSVTVPSGSTSLPPDRLLRLWSWRLWVFYNGKPVWCGVPNGIADQAAGTVTLTLTELPGYLSKRALDVVGGVTYTQAEQTAIAAFLAQPLADVGVSVLTDPGPGYLRDAFFDYLASTDRAQLLTTFATSLSAPEFRAEYYTDAGGRPHCRLRIVYPRVGAATGLGLIVPGNATDYSGTWDSDRLRTRTFATGTVPAGAASDATAPVVVVDLPQADLPRLDAIDDYQDVSLVSTLTARANTAAAQYAAPAVSISGTLPASLPALGTYDPGDDVSLLVSDPLLPGALVGTARLTQMDMDAAAGTVALTVAVSQPAPKARDTLTARLWGGTVQMARMTHKNLAPVAAQQTDTPGGTP
ncbi:MAG TPA: hypothetical protein VH136_18745 [Trebonia sp.]|nr:hypothetical protein [Trebonia sp.]